MRVNEIFYSLQGEGTFSGTPAVFIRLSGCNLHCAFCDTKHETFKEMSVDEIVHEIKRYPSKHIVITGGEPLLQVSKWFIVRLKEEGFFIQIETNGTKQLPSGGVDWVTCSPKDNFCKNAEIKLEDIDEIKVVFDGAVDPTKYLNIKAKIYYLQPCDTGDIEKNKDIIKQCVKYILNHPQWQLSLQTQKILKLR